MEVYRGDIYYIEDNYRTEGSEQRPGRPALVVSNDTGNHFSNMVSVVWLTTAEKKPLPTHCEVISRIPSTAICEQVVTISQSRLGEYIKTATEAEMKEVDKCLMIALGLGQTPDPSETVANSIIDDLKMKLEGAERELDETAMLAQQLKEENHRLRNSKPVDIDLSEVAVLKAQLEIYKQQNEKMFAILLERAV